MLYHMGVGKLHGVIGQGELQLLPSSATWISWIMKTDLKGVHPQ